MTSAERTFVALLRAAIERGCDPAELRALADAVEDGGYMLTDRARARRALPVRRQGRKTQRVTAGPEELVARTHEPPPSRRRLTLVQD